MAIPDSTYMERRWGGWATAWSTVQRRGYPPKVVGTPPCIDEGVGGHYPHPLQITSGTTNARGAVGGYMYRGVKIDQGKGRVGTIPRSMGWGYLSQGHGWVVKILLEKGWFGSRLRALIEDVVEENVPRLKGLRGGGGDEFVGVGVESGTGRL
eukprot:260522-Hanusia_phi.AAC.4